MGSNPTSCWAPRSRDQASWALETRIEKEVACTNILVDTIYRDRCVHLEGEREKCVCVLAVSETGVCVCVCVFLYLYCQ